LLFTLWYDPDPTFKGLLFASELVLKGFDMEVVTGFPDYLKGQGVLGLQNQVDSGRNN
jgi:hypothetical protein